MTNKGLQLPDGDVLEEIVDISLEELGRLCQVSADQLLELVDEGVLEPQPGRAGGRETPAQWCFRGGSVYRVHCALRLQRDLGVNYAGAALVLDLLDEIRQLRARVNRLR